jgi:radical SAM superfamily enzyme YgiQ (UPF0313 family)
MLSLDTFLAKTWVRSYTAVTGVLSRHLCYGHHDGNNLDRFRESRGEVPVLFAIPAMSDVNGALPHPGVRTLQTILRHEGIPCEVINYNLPVMNPADPTEHLIKAIRSFGVKILGVSTYSQAIRNTLESLSQIKAACPEVHIVLGGPHPTESYLSLLGVSFIDFVCRGEAEQSFPRLVRALLAGLPAGGGSIPGVYRRNPDTNEIEGIPAPFVDVDEYDDKHLLRYHFSPDELKQQRLYRGCHGTAGAEYWPVALVRGCPYDCSFCSAYQMSGKKLRYRKAARVVDDLQFYLESYGRKHFSFIDDSFTEQYDYVVDLCEEILRRKLKIYWTTDNGIRYETLGPGKRLASYLKKKGLETVDELIALMIRAGWRGTAIGIESGSDRVRKHLVRKGGAQSTNDEIVACLRNVKDVAKREGVYFYNNGFLMAGFPALPLRNGKLVPAETEEEMKQTWEFALELRDSGAIDMMNLSMVIPLPGSDMWDCLTIKDKLHVLLGCIPEQHPDASVIWEIRNRILSAYGENLESTRYRQEPEIAFWKEVYRLPDATQILILQSYDSFNADAAHSIDLDRPDEQHLWDYREGLVSDFYSGLKIKLKMLKHVLHRSGSLQDAAAYLTLLGRKYDPAEKMRAANAGGDH